MQLREDWTKHLEQLRYKQQQSEIQAARNINNNNCDNNILGMYCLIILSDNY